MGILNDKILEPYAKHINHELKTHQISSSYMLEMIANYSLGKGRMLVSLLGTLLMVIAFAAWKSTTLYLLNKNH
jgi:hypothetical protein